MATRYTSGVRQASANNYTDDISVNRIALGNVGFNPIGFTPIYTTPQFSDVNLLNNTITKMENRRYKAAESMAKVDETLAKIGDLVNPEESEWLEGVKSQTSGELQNSINNGDYSRAIYDSIQLPSKILSRADVRGRIKAQQDYQKFIDDIDKQVQSGNITSLTADRLKDTNKYYYYDKYQGETDDTAKQNRDMEQAEGIINNSVNAVGGSAWTPQNTYTKHYGLDAIVQEAYKFVSDDQGNSLSVTYLDANGNPTKDRSQSIDGQWYEQRGNKYQKLSADKLARAINQVIASNPAYGASLTQDYNDIVHKQNKEGDKFVDTYGLTNKDGIRKSEEEYISDKVREFADLKKYNYNWTSYEQNAKAIEANNARQMALNAAGAASMDFGINDLISSNNISFEFDITDGPKVALDGYTDAINKMLTIADKDGDGKAEVLESIIKNGKANYKGKDYDFDAYVKSRRNAGLMSPQEEVQLRKYKTQYDDFKGYYDKLVSSVDNKGRQAIEFQNLVLNNDNNTDNIYNKEISKLFNISGLNTSSTVDIKFSDELQKQAFIKNTGIKDINGLSLTIPVNEYSKLVQVAAAYNSGLFSGNINFSNTTNNLSYSNVGNVSGVANFAATNNNASSFLNGIGKIYNDVVGDSQRALNKIKYSSAVIYNPNFGFESFNEGNLQNLLFNGVIDSKDYNAYDKISSDQIKGSIYNGDMVNYPVYYHEGDESGNLIYMKDSQDRREINQRLQQAINNNNVIYQAGFNYKTGKAGINITVGKKTSGKYDEDGFTVFIEGLEGSKAARRFENDTDIQAATMYEQRAAYGIPYTFSGTGVPELDGTTIVPISGSEGGEIKTQQIKAISAAKAIDDLRTRANTPGYEINPDNAWALCRQAAMNIKGVDNQITAQQIYSSIFGVPYNKE